VVTLVSDIHSHKDADERDCTDDADNAVGAYACAKDFYFKTLGLGHEISPSASDSPAETNPCIGATFAGVDNKVQWPSEKMPVFQMDRFSAGGYRAYGKKALKGGVKARYTAKRLAPFRNLCAASRIPLRSLFIIGGRPESAKPIN
jgi:hypothetical protein